LRRLSLVLMLFASLSFGCGESSSVPLGPEGTKDFECSDGLDNDEDGDVDCDDSGCLDSPSCQDVSDPTDSSDPTDGSDASDLSDISDVSDVSDASDLTDATDPTDASDSSDPADTSDDSDSADATDPSDASDSTDSTDVADVTDASDVSDSSDPTDTSDSSDITDASDASDGSDSSDSADPSDTSLCDVSGFGEGEVSLDNSLPSFIGGYKVRESPVEPGRFDILSVQVYPEAPYNGPTTPGTYTIDGSNYADCGLCVLVYASCDSNLSNCVTTYFATSGNVVIDALPPQSENLDLTLSGVNLEEVTIDASSYLSTPVANGSLWCMELEVVRVASSPGNAGELEACSATADCGAGLECVANPLDASRSACLVACSAETNCGAGSECVGFTDTNAYCLPASASRDQECLSNFSVCLDDSTTCEQAEVGGEDVYRCKVTCDASNETTCGNGEACVGNGYLGDIELIDAAGDPTAQTNWVGCATSDTCGSGFECIELTVGSYCATYGGWCGEAISFCESASDLDGIAACFDSNTATCSIDAGSRYCGPIVSADASQSPALNYCVDFGLGDLGVCLGLCDGRILGDGTGPDRNCGAQGQCLALTEPLFGIEQEDASGDLVACGAGDSCSDGYQCTDFDGAVTRGCYLVEKVCQVVSSSP